MSEAVSRISKSLVVGLGLCVGCGGPMEVDPVEEPSEVVEQELGESGCATTTYDSLIDEKLFSSEFETPHLRTSPDATYDHSKACPKQYVVEVRQTLGRNIRFMGGWGDALPTTKAACEVAHAELGAYGRQNGTWKLLGTMKTKGVWEPGPFGAYVCHFSIAPIDTFPHGLIVNSPYDRVRIAAKAYRSTLKVPTAVKVSGGINSI